MKIITYLIFLFSSICFANPSGEKVIAGKVKFDRANNHLKIIQKSNKAIINWKDFSLEGYEITQFIQPSQKSAVLNRVVSNNPSEIFGKIQANGKVALINQNGIYISLNAQIDTYGWIASTLDVANEDFLSGKDLSLSGDSKNNIINDGEIVSEIGDVLLVASEVINNGKITAKNGSAYLIGTNDLLLIDQTQPKIAVRTASSVRNSGTIEATHIELRAVGGNAYSLAVNQEGILEANDVQLKDGKVILCAEEGQVSVTGKVCAKNVSVMADEIDIKESATIDASSDHLAGEIFIGRNGQELSEVTRIARGAKILSNARSDADGGVVIIDSNALTVFDGEIEAKSFGYGKGGFVEISSKDVLIPNGKIDVSSAHGEVGTILFDPGSVEILPGIEESKGAVFYDSYINELLKTANVEIKTADLADADEIIIRSGTLIEWDAPTSLLLRASKTIVMETDAQIKNTAAGEFVAVDFQTKRETGNFSGIILEKGSCISSHHGDISLEGNSGNIGDANYGIYVGGKITSEALDENSAKITLIGNARRGDNQNFGVFVKEGSVQSNLGDITITGSSLGSQENNHGIYLEGKASIISQEANITLNGVGGGTNSKGIFISDAKVQSNKGNVSLDGKQAGSSSIFLSALSDIYAQNRVNLIADRSLVSFGQVKADGNIFASLDTLVNGHFVMKQAFVANSVMIEGGAANDTFVIDCNAKGILDAKGGMNTLVASDQANTFVIEGENFGTLNTNLRFANIQNIKGSSYLEDTFILHPLAKLDGKLDAQGGNNTLRAADLENIWHITASDTGYIENVVSFTNIQNIIGNNQNDLFKIYDFAEISGLIDGTGGENVLDFSAHSSGHIIDLHKYKNMKKIIGGKGIDTLLGPQKSSKWIISSKNAGRIDDIAFEQIENLLSGDHNDSFIITDEGSLDGYLDGNHGYNQLIAPNKTNTWNITDQDEGYIEGIVHFKNIQHLIGGQGEDLFLVSNTGSFVRVDGGSKENNFVDFSEKLEDTIVDLKTIRNIQHIKGATGTTTLKGKDIANVWQITDNNCGIVNDQITFENVENLEGGALCDIFVFSKMGVLDGEIKGGRSPGQNVLDYSAFNEPIEANVLQGIAPNTKRVSDIDVVILPNIELPQIKNPPTEVAEVDLYVFHMPQHPKLQKNKKVLEMQQNMLLLKRHVEKKTYVAANNSPYMISKRQAKKQFSTVHLSSALHGNKVADSNLRVKNNVKDSISSINMGTRGDLKAAKTQYNEEQDTLDAIDFDVVHENFTEQAIKQRPRPLHFSGYQD